MLDDSVIVNAGSPIAFRRLWAYRFGIVAFRSQAVIFQTLGSANGNPTRKRGRRQTGSSFTHRVSNKLTAVRTETQPNQPTNLNHFKAPRTHDRR